MYRLARLRETFHWSRSCGTATESDTRDQEVQTVKEIRESTRCAVLSYIVIVICWLSAGCVRPASYVYHIDPSCAYPKKPVVPKSWPEIKTFAVRLAPSSHEYLMKNEQFDATDIARFTSYFGGTNSSPVAFVTQSTQYLVLTVRSARDNHVITRLKEELNFCQAGTMTVPVVSSLAEAKRAAARASAMAKRLRAQAKARGETISASEISAQASQECVDTLRKRIRVACHNALINLLTKVDWQRATIGHAGKN